MVRAFLGVYMCGLLLSSVVLCDDPCPRACVCSYPHTGELSVSCNDDIVGFRELVAALPAQTRHFSYILPPWTPWTFISMGTANFSHLPSLESLYLLDNKRHSEPQASMGITNQQMRVFWPLRNLQELKINITWDISTDLPELLSQCEKLRVLDLSDTRKFGLTHLGSMLRGLQNRKSFEILNLRNTNAHMVYNIMFLQFVLQGLENCSLTELDISENGIFHLFPGLIMHATMLKQFNARRNLLSLDMGILLDIIMHPTLIEADLSSQGLYDPRRNLIIEKSLEQFDNLSMEADREKKRDLLINPKYLGWTNCFAKLSGDFCNIYSPQCVSVLQNITQWKSQWCDVLFQIYPLSHIPCDVIPPASDLLDPHCAGCLVIPLVGNVRTLHLHNIRQNTLLIELLSQDTCFHPGNHLEVINLSNNGIQNFTLNLTNLSKLSTIDLSGNKIHSLSVNMINQLSGHAIKHRNRTLKIDLSSNPLHCSCSNRHFTNWVVSKPQNIEFLNFNKYRCLDEKFRKNLFHKLGRLGAFDCLGEASFIGLGVGSGVLISVIVAAVCTGIYRKRWWIRYNYFLARQIWSRSNRQDEQSREYRWDVFVCYNHHDKDWVTERLRPKLEDEHGIRLCLHERDFELGHYISDLVIESIDNSRKTLLVLSPHFVQSNWCMFEMRMAHQKLFTTGHDVLMLAILQPLGNVNSKILKALLEQRNYVEWIDDAYGRKLFWARLLKALNPLSTRTASNGAVPQTPSCSADAPSSSKQPANQQLTGLFSKAF